MGEQIETLAQFVAETHWEDDSGGGAAACEAGVARHLGRDPGGLDAARGGGSCGERLAASGGSGATVYAVAGPRPIRAPRHC